MNVPADRLSSLEGDFYSLKEAAALLDVVATRFINDLGESGGKVTCERIEPKDVSAVSAALRCIRKEMAAFAEVFDAHISEAHNARLGRSNG